MSNYKDMSSEVRDNISPSERYVVELWSRKGNEYTDIRLPKCSNLEGDVQRLEQCVGMENGWKDEASSTEAQKFGQTVLQALEVPLPCTCQHHQSREAD